jgi:hypothetical protein
MAVAYFMAHAPQGLCPLLNRGELAALYSFVFTWRRQVVGVERESCAAASGVNAGAALSQALHRG